MYRATHLNFEIALYSGFIGKVDEVEAEGIGGGGRAL